MKYKNKQEERLIIQFFEELGWIVHKCKDCVEFETWTKAGVHITITLLNMTFDELSEYLDAVSCAEEINSLRQDERYRKQFTLKQSVNDIYGFFCGLDEEWDKFLVFHKK